MAEKVPAGTWVEVGAEVLPPGERAPQVPEDTQAVPLEMRVKGVLMAPAAPGDAAEIETPAGRRLTGRLTAVNPPHGHTFGAPIPELSPIGAELRAMLAEGEAAP